MFSIWIFNCSFTKEIRKYYLGLVPKLRNASKKIVRDNYIDCKLAPTSMHSNRSSIFARLKDDTPLTCIKFAVFTIGCENCPFRKIFKTENLDVQRTIKHHFNRQGSPIMEHLSQFRSHSIPTAPRNLFALRNRGEVNSVYNRSVHEDANEASNRAVLWFYDVK